MLFGDTYKTIVSPAAGEFKDRGSRFTGYIFPVSNEEEVKAALQQVKKEHYSAAHHCYAYVLGHSQEIQKSNDDREPANSAGKPILRAILSAGLTDVLVIVVRYFGGKLLGIPGLINAYGEAGTQAITHARVIEKTVTEQYRLVFGYEHENEAFRLVKQHGLKVLSHHHGEQITLVFEVRRSPGEKVLDAIREKRIFEVTFLTESSTF